MPDAEVVGNVVDLQPNDPFYDEDGNLVGTVIEVETVEAEDGGPDLVGIVYLDAETGEEVMEIVERTENRDPK
jgi:hypothetical protein